MKFRDLVEELALGYLSNTSLVDGNEVTKDKLPKLVQFINRALEHFYSTLNLKDSQVVIKLHDGISHYYLDSEYAESNVSSDNKYKYIKDTSLNPFTDTLIQIEVVATLDGRCLAMDDPYSTFGVLIPEYNCIHIPYDLGVDYLSIVYQDGHQRISLSEPITSTLNIQIPVPVTTAFMSYVACLYMQSMGGNNHNESNAYFATYRSQMELLMAQGIGVKSRTGTNIKPLIRGWK